MFEFLTRKQRAAQLSSSLKVYIILKVIEAFFLFYMTWIVERDVSGHVHVIIFIMVFTSCLNVSSLKTHCSYLLVVSFLSLSAFMRFSHNASS